MTELSQQKAAKPHPPVQKNSSKTKPSRQRYTSENRWKTNALRRQARHEKRVAKKTWRLRAAGQLGFGERKLAKAKAHAQHRHH